MTTTRTSRGNEPGDANKAPASGSNLRNGNRTSDTNGASAVTGDLLGTLIREAIAEHPRESADNIAEYLLRSKIPQAHIQRYFLQLLTRYVKDVHRFSANEARNDALREGPSKSPKYQERQRLWQRMLDETVIINGVSKRYGDCTREDLIWRIEQQNVLIGRIQNQIENDQRIIKLMDDHKATTVDGVPEQATK